LLQKLKTSVLGQNIKLIRADEGFAGVDWQGQVQKHFGKSTSAGASKLCASQRDKWALRFCPGVGSSNKPLDAGAEIVA